MCFQAHNRTNCIAQFVPEASVWATELDALTPDQRKRLPLLGIPFCVKEELAMKGGEEIAFAIFHFMHKFTKNFR